MNNAARDETATCTPIGVPCEAVVSAVTGARSVQVQTRAESIDATVATVGEYRPRVGDRVLVLLGESEAFIVGVLGSLRPVTSAPEATSDGVAAEVAADGSSLVVRGATGEVLFTHDARTGRSTVVGSQLNVHATHGDLSLEAARTVRIRGKKVELRAGEEESFSLGPKGASLASRALRAVLDEGRFTIGETTFAGKRIDSAVEKARHFVDVAEHRVGRLVERAGDTFREVDGVSQTRAGRIRTVAKGAYHVLAKRATVRAEDDLALMGEKISLA